MPVPVYFSSHKFEENGSAQQCFFNDCEAKVRQEEEPVREHTSPGFQALKSTLTFIDEHHNLHLLTYLSYSVAKCSDCLVVGSASRNMPRARYRSPPGIVMSFTGLRLAEECVPHCNVNNSLNQHLFAYLIYSERIPFVAGR